MVKMLIRRRDYSPALQAHVHQERARLLSGLCQLSGITAHTRYGNKINVYKIMYTEVKITSVIDIQWLFDGDF